MRPADRICPFKGRKRSNTATSFNGFVIEEIFFLRIKWLPLHKVPEMTLGFVKLRGVYDATIGIRVTGGVRTLLSVATFDKNCTYRRELVAGAVP